MVKYAAFLRGINVGGRKVTMEDLQQVFESLGFKDVKTFIASGNVVFESDSSDSTSLTYNIEQKLKTQFGFDIAIMLRSLEDLQALASADPFKGVASDSKTKLYVTFLTDKPEARLGLPYKHPDKNFTIVRLSDTEACSVLTLSSGTGTTDLMKFLEKQFGKNITTRNWNTIQKLLA